MHGKVVKGSFKISLELTALHDLAYGCGRQDWIPGTVFVRLNLCSVLRTLASAVALFFLNVYITLRLFQVGVYHHMLSAEGLFVGLTRFIAANWGDLTWLPLFHCGMPFHNVYAPGVPVTAAIVATIMHWDANRAYHFAVALLYCFGPPLLFWAAWRLSGRFRASFCAGLLWSILSPSCLIEPSVWRDTGGMISNRRLHSIVFWGDSPNGVTLGLVVLAIGALHLALTRRRPLDFAGATVAVALVMLFSWPASIAMVMAICCYLLSREVSEWRRMTARLAGIGIFSYAIAAPWIPPSTLISTYKISQVMQNAVPHEHARMRAVVGFLLILGLIAARFALSRAPSWFRFATLYTMLTGGVTLVYEFTGLVLIAQAGRFHLAMEIGIILMLAFGASLLLNNHRRWPYAMAIALVILTARQTIVARRYARLDTLPADRSTLIEAETADWFQRNLPGERVWTVGSVSFWLNAFGDSPQLGGCCDQSNTNPLLNFARYELILDPSSANRELWLRALGIHGFAVGGPKSREIYHDTQHQQALLDAFSCPWHDGDDYACVIPSRTGSLGHVMTKADLVARAPQGSLDLEPFLPFVAALENPVYPIAELLWPNHHTARVEVNLKSDQILSLQITYFSGWRATANGLAVPVVRDNLGFMYVEPRCDGACSIEMIYDGGPESRALWWLRLVAVMTGLGWLIVVRK